MIGKGNVVEIVVDIVGVESGPAAVAALQAGRPFDAAGNGLVIAVARRELAARAIHGHDHDRRIVQIGIMGVAILEGPAAGAHVRAPLGPIPLHVALLQRPQPGQAALGGARRLLAACTSIRAWLASAVSQTGETQGWQ